MQLRKTFARIQNNIEISVHYLGKLFFIENGKLYKRCLTNHDTIEINKNVLGDSIHVLNDFIYIFHEKTVNITTLSGTQVQKIVLPRDYSTIKSIIDKEFIFVFYPKSAFFTLIDFLGKAHQIKLPNFFKNRTIRDISFCRNECFVLTNGGVVYKSKYFIAGLSPKLSFLRKRGSFENHDSQLKPTNTFQNNYQKYNSLKTDCKFTINNKSNRMNFKSIQSSLENPSSDECCGINNYDPITTIDEEMPFSLGEFEELKFINTDEFALEEGFPVQIEFSQQKAIIAYTNGIRVFKLCNNLLRCIYYIDDTESKSFFIFKHKDSIFSTYNGLSILADCPISIIGDKIIKFYGDLAVTKNILYFIDTPIIDVNEHLDFENIAQCQNNDFFDSEIVDNFQQGKRDFSKGGPCFDHMFSFLQKIDDEKEIRRIDSEMSEKDFLMFLKEVNMFREEYLDPLEIQFAILSLKIDYFQVKQSLLKAQLEQISMRTQILNDKKGKILDRISNLHKRINSIKRVHLAQHIDTTHLKRADNCLTALKNRGNINDDVCAFLKAQNIILRDKMRHGNRE